MNLTNTSSCPDVSLDSQGEKAAKTLAYAVVILTSLVGNVLVIAVVYTNRKMHTITNYQIVNMSIADILITAAAMPAIVFQIYKQNHWPFGLFLCKIVSFMQGLSVSCSVFTMVCIAVDRYLAILFPYKKYITPRRSHFMIALVWILSVLLQSPTLYAMRVTRAPDGETECVEKWTPHFNTVSAAKLYTVILFVFMYLLPLIVIAVLYASISWFLWSREVPGNRLGKQRSDRAKTRKVIKMLVIIVVVFAVCWLPIFVTQFVAFFATPECGVAPALVFLGFFLSHANSAINPCIYAMFNDTYREGFKQVIVTWCVPRSLIRRRESRRNDTLETAEMTGRNKEDGMETDTKLV